jgi:hypothetical protein
MFTNTRFRTFQLIRHDRANKHGTDTHLLTLFNVPRRRMNLHEHTQTLEGVEVAKVRAEKKVELVGHGNSEAMQLIA